VYDRRKDGTELYAGTWTTDPSWDWDALGEPYPDGIGLSPPPGLVEPKRGFGWVWRTYLRRESGALGWALEEERGLDNVGQSQAFEGGVVFHGGLPKVYVLLNDGRFFAE
jgi:hypothetical protein